MSFSLPNTESTQSLPPVYSRGRAGISSQFTSYSLTSTQRQVQPSPPTQKALLIQPCPSCDHISPLWVVRVVASIVGGRRWVIPGEACCLQVLLTICCLQSQTVGIWHVPVQGEKKYKTGQKPLFLSIHFTLGQLSVAKAYVYSVTKTQPTKAIFLTAPEGHRRLDSDHDSLFDSELDLTQHVVTCYWSSLWICHHHKKVTDFNTTLDHFRLRLQHAFTVVMFR